MLSRDCMTLKEAVKRAVDKESEYLYNFFALEDLLFSIDQEGSNSRESEETRRTTEDTCSALLDRYNLPLPTSGDCSWSCSYHHDQIPRYQIKAVHNTGNTFLCNGVVLRTKRFVRRDCAYNSSLPYWHTCKCDQIVGYINY